MREDFELCTYFKFHQQKVVFFLAAMRTYAEELKDSGIRVHYEKLSSSDKPYEFHFLKFLNQNHVDKLYAFEIEDHFFEKRILEAVRKESIQFHYRSSPQFLTSRIVFKRYVEQVKKPFMKTFYEGQRKRLKVLMETDGKPTGGRWSYDDQNRMPLPKKVNPPSIHPAKVSSTVEEVQKLIQTYFSDHPGCAQDFWLPVSRTGVKKHLSQFLNERLCFFGPYEDAISARSDFLFHSVLSPFLNTGLLTPDEVVIEVLKTAKKNKISLHSVEGFIRQLIGWREFIRGIYHEFGEEQLKRNFWKHRRKLAPSWYDGTTGVVPLDHTIKKIMKLGYAHHIERLMVVGSLMLLLEIHPHEAYRWFMEMFIDSADWVMGPNVFGMALFSDGGIFATKPYICGSNYYRKMGGYTKGEWCEGVDGLYWGFIEKNRSYFEKNPRMSFALKSLKKMPSARKEKIFSEAKLLRKKITRV